MRPHVHAPWRTRTVLNLYLLASLPAAVVGTWNLGWQTLSVVGAGDAAALPGWLETLTDAAAAGATPMRLAVAGLVGLGWVVPLVLVALGTSAFWAAVFSRARNKPADAGWLVSGWLFVWLLPPATTPAVAALAMSFGAVVGAHIFGGTGRYLVSPALLGALFVHFGYPEFLSSPLPVTTALSSDWQAVAADGPGALRWTSALLGTVPGGLGTGSAFACLVGAALLVGRQTASWRVLAGAVLGMLLAWVPLALWADGSVASLPVYWHPVLGSFAFALAFIATDPSPAPLTRTTRWLYGGLFGALTVLIRTLDPTHPEGSLFALVLATLAVPLLDHLALRRYRRAGAAS